MTVSRKDMLRGIAASALFMVAGCERKAASAKGPRTEINFSILSTENAQNMEPLWKPFLEDMSKQTGLTIKPYFGSNYTTLIEAMRFDKVQLGWFSNASGLEAVRRSDGEVFARSSDTSGVDGYQSVIITRADSPLTAEDLLKCDGTKTFGMGDVKSTSGTLAPMTYFFLPAKVDPAKCFKSVRSAGHEVNFLAVANGVVDAATNNNASLERMGQAHPEKLKQVKVIWTSPTLPEDPIIWRKDLDPATKEKIRSFFLTYGTGKDAEGARQLKVLNNLLFGVFKPADNTHLLPVREMEAAEALIQAQNAGDAAAVEKAKADLAAVTKEADAVKAAPQAAPDAQ
ncbi:phosphate/phosphite/phosphonate ABC transporter substrate-binding protein [Asticcacaulis sp. BYS171W]|uniref:Phosphate/phosphite/phosphonate ABC transporter substrate-binding protein n=1 Tax=Asticcacaulis aquaticus TaxID=2984212 RepID=A0ABT5HRH3_9CAUL|nr:phosphate/phosphite/phosphonate ABC transporter substrate-binding protein [Asticcacaulis aquaticus]MDC7682668.1 phosphate/phosphite/phosphonate ABC transporter substrate-binding protein [Asticcacaulis aquaticus]